MSEYNATPPLRPLVSKDGFLERVWERFFLSLNQEVIASVEEQDDSGGSMASYFTDQLEKLIESIPPQADYLHRIEELEQQITPTTNFLNQLEDLEKTVASTPPPIADSGLFLKLAGRPGGQIAYGGTGTGEDLTIYSNTRNDGKIYFGANSAYDEGTDRWGFGTTTPTAKVDILQTGVTDIAGNVEAIQQTMTIDAGGPSSAAYVALDSRITTTGAENYTGSINGFVSSYAHTGTGSLTKILGNAFNVINTVGALNQAIGFQVLIRNLGAGSIFDGTAFRALAADKTAGTFTNYYGFRAQYSTEATNNYAFYADGGASIFNAGGATVAPLTLKGAAAQAEPLLQLQKSDDTVYTAFDAIGQVSGAVEQQIFFMGGF